MVSINEKETKKYNPGKLYKLMWDDYAYTISGDNEITSFAFTKSSFATNSIFLYLGKHILAKGSGLGEQIYDKFLNVKNKQIMLFPQSSFIHLFDEVE